MTNDKKLSDHEWFSLLGEEFKALFLSLSSNETMPDTTTLISKHEASVSFVLPAPDPSSEQVGIYFEVGFEITGSRSARVIADLVDSKGNRVSSGIFFPFWCLSNFDSSRLPCEVADGERVLLSIVSEVRLRPILSALYLNEKTQIFLGSPL